MTDADVCGVLDHYATDERPSLAPTSLGNAGGLSGSRLWRFPSANGWRLLRAHPQGARGIERIHGWLSMARGLDFVPQPVATRDGATIVERAGRIWSLEPWLPGSPDLGSPPTVEHVRAAFTGLAEFHSRLAEAGSEAGRSPGLSSRSVELQRLLDGGFREIEGALSRQAHDPLVGLAAEWLERAKARTPAAQTILERALPWGFSWQPCLRDARPEHFLFLGDALGGLVDFGAMDQDSVAVDLARLVGEWLPRGSYDELRAEGLRAYQRLRVLRGPELAAAYAFEVAADVLIGERWVRWRFLERRAFDERIFEEGLARGVRRSALAWINTWE